MTVINTSVIIMILSGIVFIILSILSMAISDDKDLYRSLISIAVLLLGALLTIIPPIIMNNIESEKCDCGKVIIDKYNYCPDCGKEWKHEP